MSLLAAVDVDATLAGATALSLGLFACSEERGDGGTGGGAVTGVGSCVGKRAESPGAIWRYPVIDNELHTRAKPLRARPSRRAAVTTHDKPAHFGAQASATPPAHARVWSSLAFGSFFRAPRPLRYRCASLQQERALFFSQPLM